MAQDGGSERGEDREGGDNGEGSNGQGREKRRRITQSCNMCRKKRIKCDGKEPRCGPCTSKDIECAWAETKKRGPVPGKNVQARIQRLETHVAELFQLVPGLEDLSMMVLGLSSYRPSHISLVPNLPPSLDALRAMQSKGNRQNAFKDGPIGKLFSDEANDSGEGSSSVPPNMQQYGTAGLDEGSSAVDHTSGNSGYDFNPEQGGFSNEPMSVADIIKMLSNGQQSALHLYTTPAQSGSYSDNSLSTPASFANSGNFATTPQSALMPLSSPQIDVKPQLNKNDTFIWEHNKHTGTCRVYGRSSNFKQLLPIGPRSFPPKFQTPDFPPQMQRTRLIDAYLTIIHPLLPMCSRASLMQWSCSPQPNLDANLQPELLFAVLATASFYSSPAFPGSGTAHLHQASEMAKAARWCLKSSLSTPTLATIQTLTLLALYNLSTGDFTKAWADLGLAMGLAIDLGLPQSYQVLSADEPTSIAQRTTWYCILTVETGLATLLGKPVLLSASCAYPPIPPESGPDEWELWRSESVQSLEFSYGGLSSGPSSASNGGHGNELNTSPVQSFGIITPARTLSTFAQSATLMRLARQVLDVLNTTSPKDQEAQNLRASLHRLEEFKQNLMDIEISETSLASVPQHRLDLYSNWLYWKATVLKHLARIDGSFQASLDALAWQASSLLAIKSRLFTHYRTCALSLLLPFSASYLWPNSDQIRHPATSSLQQSRRIFPDLIDKVRHAMRDPTVNEPMQTPASAASYGPSFASPSFHMPIAQPLPLPPDWPASLGILDFDTNPQSASTSNSHHLSNLLAPVNMATGQAGTPSAGTGLHAQDAMYSLPFAAMQNLSEQVGLGQSSQPFETSKIFDSASWAQTDVLSSLGFTTDTPRGSPDHVANEFSGLTGLLDRWNYSDGFSHP